MPVNNLAPLIILATSIPAWPCQCASASPATLLRSSDVVAEIVIAPIDSKSRYRRVTTILNVWKGNLQMGGLFYDSTSLLCTIPTTLEPGKPTIVYLHWVSAKDGGKPRLSTGLCARIVSERFALVRERLVLDRVTKRLPAAVRNGRV